MWKTRRCPGSGCPTIESSPTDSSPSPLTRWQVQIIVAFHSFDPFFSALTWSTLQRAQSGPCEYTRWVKLQAWRETFVYSYYLAKNCGQGLFLYTNFTCGKASCIMHIRLRRRTREDINARLPPAQVGGGKCIRHR